MNVFDVTMQLQDYLGAVLRYLIPGRSEDPVSTDSSRRAVQAVADSLSGTGSSISRDLQVSGAIQQQHVGAEFLILEIIGTLVPIAFLAAAGLLLWKRLESRKTIELAMIEKGLDPRRSAIDRDSTLKFRALRFGMLLVGVGLGLFAAMIIWSIFKHVITVDDRPLVALTSVMFFSGLALTVYHIIASSLEKR